MSVSERRRQRKEKAAAVLAASLVEETAQRIVDARDRNDELQAAKAAERAAGHVELRSPAPSSPQDQPQEVKRLRDGGMAWWVIGQTLGLAGTASSAADPEGKRGAGRARALYAAANRGEVPRSHAPRKGAQVRPQGPARGGTVTSRKQQLVTEGHVIPRDMPDAEVEALVLGRTIEWAIDLARLTGTEPASWGTGAQRWFKQEARVHVDPQWVKVVDRSDEGKDRILYFREYAGFDTDREKHMSGPTRVVRVDSIYTVR